MVSLKDTQRDVYIDEIQGRKVYLGSQLKSAVSPSWWKMCGNRSLRELVTLHPVRKQRQWSAQLTFPFLCCPGCQSIESVLSHTYCGSPTSTNSMQKFSQTCPEVCFHGNSESHQPDQSISLFSFIDNIKHDFNHQ